MYLHILNISILQPLDPLSSINDFRYSIIFMYVLQFRKLRRAFPNDNLWMRYGCHSMVSQH